MAKGPGGRPTKYKPEYCQLLIEHMEKGFSFRSFSGVIKTSIECIYHWRDTIPEFSDAEKHGRALELLFYEKIGQAGMTGQIPGFNLGAWIFNMKNRFKWTDRFVGEIEHTGTVSHEYRLDASTLVKDIEHDPILSLPLANK